MLMLISLCILIPISIATAYLAQMRGRDPISWFVIGALLGLLGLAMLYILPKKEVNTAPLEEAEVLQTSDSKGLITKNLELADWYYLDHEHHQKGPMDSVQLQRCIDHGQLTDETLVWTEGMKDWVEIQTLAQFKLSKNLTLIKTEMASLKS